MKLTKIALALAAVLAMSAVMASSASALEYKSTVNPVMLFGEDNGNHTFTIDGQNVTCTNAVFEKASQAVPTKEISGINAAYSGCTAFGFAATVNMGSCTYRLNEPKKMNETEFTANVSLVCPNNPATINTNVIGSECSVSISGSGNNSNLPHITIVIVSPRWVIVITIGTITATKNKDNAFCPLSGTGTVNNASYNGPLTVEGTGGASLSIS